MKPLEMGYKVGGFVIRFFFLVKNMFGVQSNTQMYKKYAPLVFHLPRMDKAKSQNTKNQVQYHCQ